MNSPGHQSSIVFEILVKLDVDKVFQLLGVKQFGQNSLIDKIAGETLCRVIPMLCRDIIFLFAGWDQEIPGRNMNDTRLPTYIYNTPAGTSVKNMVHWAQLIRSNAFQMYDYGTPEKNLQHYNRTVAPVYNLGNLNPTSSPKISLYSGGADVLADRVDVQRLVSDLPPGVVDIMREIPEYQHLDFTWGMDAHKRIYAEAIENVKRHLGGLNKTSAANNTVNNHIQNVYLSGETESDEGSEKFAVADWIFS